MNNQKSFTLHEIMEDEAICPHCKKEKTRWQIIDEKEVPLLCIDCSEELAYFSGLG